MIEAVGASLRYFDHGEAVYACHNLNLKLEEGEFLGVLGPSGSGKSSLLYLLSGLKVPTEGRVLFEGRDLSDMPEPERAQLRLKNFGFVFQQPFLLGYLSALENVLVGVHGRHVERRAFELLEQLGLGEKTHRLPHELSGGEKQRVCVARALVNQPKVIFADEPTASLDAENGRQVVQLLKDLRGDGALVMVTHDPSMLGDTTRIVKIEEGRIVDPPLHRLQPVLS
jgi:putative ABC transport system ATP-binding protein